MLSSRAPIGGWDRPTLPKRPGWARWSSRVIFWIACDTVRLHRSFLLGARQIGAGPDVTQMGTVSAMAESAIDAFGDDKRTGGNNAALYGGLTGGRFDSAGSKTNGTVA